MRIARDFEAYHRSIGEELRVTKDRIRNLIGSSHWQTDGLHKEVLLRKVLRAHCAESLHVGTGFVCGSRGNSHQTDILISRRDKPTLFQDGELRLVTPDAVAAIIEVKSTPTRDYVGVLSKLADDVRFIRTSGNSECRAGLFIYASDATPDGHERLLRAVHTAADGDEARAINWIAVGPDTFIRYRSGRSTGRSPADDSVWRIYHLDGLAHAYFVSNVVWGTCLDTDDPAAHFAWFPIQGGKERYRTMYVSLRDPEVHTFEETVQI